MKLGAFSICLTVKDIHKSKEFYEKSGFTYKGEPHPLYEHKT
jgi:predicted lactoylglutathione lyase